MTVLPENRQVRRLHQHLHQGVHHLRVENDGVHHFTELLVIGYAETGFGNASVGLKRVMKRSVEIRFKIFFPIFIL